MSGAITIASASFTQSVSSLTLPDRRDLIGEYILGGNSSQSIINYANAAKSMTVDGAPTYNAHSAVVEPGTGGFGFETGLLTSIDATFLCIRKAGTNNTAVGSSPDAPVGFTDFETTNSWFNNGETAYPYGAPGPPLSASAFTFQAGVRVYDGYGRIYYYSAGAQQVGVATQSGNISLDPICIGTASIGGDPYTCEVAYVALFNRTLTPAQIDAAYKSLVAFYATLGVTVS